MVLWPDARQARGRQPHTARVVARLTPTEWHEILPRRETKCKTYEGCLFRTGIAEARSLRSQPAQRSVSSLLPPHEARQEAMKSPGIAQGKGVTRLPSKWQPDSPRVPFGKGSYWFVKQMVARFPKNLFQKRQLLVCEVNGSQICQKSLSGKAANRL